MFLLMIDPDLVHRTESFYLEALQERAGEKFEIRPFTTVDAAWNFFEREHRKIAAIVTEIMMWPDQLFAGREEKLHYGRETGLALCDKARELAPGMPFIFLSYLRDEDIVQAIKTRPNTLFLNKLHTLPDEFSAAVLHFLEPVAAR